MKRLGIIGARGYTGAELMKLVASHSRLSLVAVSSRQLEGQKVASACPSLSTRAEKDLLFSNLGPDAAAAFSASHGVDAWVLALPNGLASPYVEAFSKLGAQSPILVDLSADHRFNTAWTYGFPERHRAAIRRSRLIANPGCYATAAQSSILPFAGLLKAGAPPTVFGVSGYSGAGTNPSDKNDPVRLEDNLLAYSLSNHMHEREVSRQVGTQVFFAPHVAPFFQGIHLTTVMQLESGLKGGSAEAAELARRCFPNEPLVRVVDKTPEVKDIMNKHHVELGAFDYHAGTNRVTVVATIDNLLKGAATQCLQNLNLTLGLDELEGIDVVRGANANPLAVPLRRDAETENDRLGLKSLAASTTPSSSSSSPSSSTSSSSSVIARAEENFVKTYARFPLVLSQGHGSVVETPEGRRLIDWYAGIAVSALGHGHPHWVRALVDQAQKLAHTSNLVYTEVSTRLAERLVASTFADRVFLANTGCEANEGALKFALLHGQAQRPTKTKVLAFTHSFHGRTLGALSLTHKPAYRAPFDTYLTGGHPARPDSERFAEFNDLASAARLIGDDTAAVIVEPVQGEGGVHPASREFLAGLRALCDKHKALLIFDEVQIGLARSGSFLAHTQFGVTPDILTLAKPLGGGLPIGAILATNHALQHLKPGQHGTTFGGGPLVCAAANAVLDIIETPVFLNGVQRRSDHLLAGLRAIKSDKIVEVRGMGLLVAVELSTPADAIITKARDLGLILISAGENVIRIAPPLNIPFKELDDGLKIFAQALQA